MTGRRGGMEMFLVRVGDAERDECVAMLTEHHVRGRLAIEELHVREQAAMQAVTAADLAALLADLPALTRNDRRPARRPTSRPAPRRAPRRAPRVHDPARLADRRRRRLRAVLGGSPPAAVVTSAAIFTASLDNYYVSPESILAATLVTGGVGVVTQWVSARLRRRL